MGDIKTYAQQLSIRLGDSPELNTGLTNPFGDKYTYGYFEKKTL